MLKQIKAERGRVGGQTEHGVQVDADIGKEGTGGGQREHGVRD